MTAGGGLRSLPELTTVAQLLAGQEEALHLAAERCETWYEWLVARLLYTLPTVKTYELGLHGAQAVDRFGGLGSMTTLDSVLLAPLEADIPQVVRELCLSLDNFWFSAHLLDLLHHAGALGQTEGEQHGPVLKIRFGPPTADFWSVWSSQKARKFRQIQPTT